MCSLPRYFLGPVTWVYPTFFSPYLSACSTQRCMGAKSLQSCWLFVTLWTVTRQAPLAVGLSRQEYWSGLLFPSPRNLPNLGFKAWSLALQVDSSLSEPPGKPQWHAERHSSVQFNHSVVSDSLQPRGLQHARLPCPSPTPRACTNSYPLTRGCPPPISSSVTPFSSCLTSPILFCLR